MISAPGTATLAGVEIGIYTVPNSDVHATATPLF
jgi:hypothetical protein